MIDRSSLRNPRAFLAASAALAGLLAPMAARAQGVAFWWNVHAPSGVWSNNANWRDGQAPPPNGLGSTQVITTSGAVTSFDLGAGYSIRGISFNLNIDGGVSPSYTFVSGSLVVGAGGIIQSSPADQEFRIPVSLGTASQIFVGELPEGGTGALRFIRGLALGSNELTINALGSSTIAGAISGSGTLTKLGPATTALTGVSTKTGQTFVTGGTLALGSGGSLGGGVYVKAGATFRLAGGGSFTLASGADYLEADGTAGSSGRIAVEGGTVSTNVVVLGVNGLGVMDVTGGAVEFAGTQFSVLGLGSGSSGVLNAGGGTLSFPFGLTVGKLGAGTVNQTGGVVTGRINLGLLGGSTGTYHLDDGVLQATAVATGAGASVFNFNGGTLQATSSGTGFFQGIGTANVRRGGAVFDTNGFNVTVAQPLVHSTIPLDNPVDGGLTKLGAGTLTLTGANTYTGATTIKAGTIAVANDALLGSGKVVNIGRGAALAFTDAAVSTARAFNLVSSVLAPASGGTLTYLSGATVSGGGLGAGSHVLSGGSEFIGVRVAPGAALSQASGIVHFTDVTLAGDSTFAQAGTLSCEGDFTTQPASTLTIAGACNLTGGFLSGAVTVAGTGRLNESGASTPLYLDGSRGVTIQAGGRLSAASGSTVELGGLLTNNGVQAGVLNVNLGGVVRGTGAFGTVNLLASSTFAASGTIGGALSVADGALVSVDGPGKTLAVLGQFVNNGTMRFTNGARLQVTSPANQVVNTGTIDVISGRLELPAGFVNNGVIIDSSVVRVKEVGRANGSVAVKIDGYPGHTYRLQRSASLTGGSFADVPGVAPQANPASASAVVTLTFTDVSPDAGEGFYRVVVDA